MPRDRNHQVPGPGLNTTEPPEPTYHISNLRPIANLAKWRSYVAHRPDSRMAVGLFGHERPHNPARPMNHLGHVVR